MATEVLPLPPLPQPAPYARLAPLRGQEELSPPLRLMTTGTLALWLVCLAVGAVGLRLHYPGGHLQKEPTPVVAKIIRVDLSDDPSPADSGSPLATPEPVPPAAVELPPPAAPAPVAPADAPPLLAVATPDPVIAFAIPVKGPSQTVDPKLAAPVVAPQQPAATNAAPAATSGAAVVHRLTYGRGEGSQPKPEYPREAILARQEGVVGVRFTVAESGKVAAAEVVSPCRWPMLNQAALRAIRDRWHFAPGEARIYEISIHYQLAE